MGAKKTKEIVQGPAPFEGCPSTDELSQLLEERDYTQLKKMGGVKSLCQRLQVESEKAGLTESSDDLEKRRAYYGRNEYPSPPATTWFEMYADTWGDLTVKILAVSALIAFVGGLLELYLANIPNGWIEGLAIFVAVLLVTSITATNDYIKDLQFRRLREKTAKGRMGRVIRKNVDEPLNVNDIVVGDIVPLFTGDQVPADGIFIPTGEEFACDESSMTGEPDQKKKDKRHPFLLSGTFVSKGAGKMLVLQVGARSEWGKLLANLQSEDEKTPLQEKLHGVVILVGKIGLACGIITFAVLMIYWILDYAVAPYKRPLMCTVPSENMTFYNATDNTTVSVWNNGVVQANLLPPANATAPVVYCGAANLKEVVGHGASGPKANTSYEVYAPANAFQPTNLMRMLNVFIFAVTVVVVAIPEGLPLAVLVSLAFSMRQMTKDQNLVRHLQACEIMGGATDICSDKTGTLTENRMSVVAGWIAGKPFTKFADLSANDDVKKLLADALCLNVNDGRLIKPEEGAVDLAGASTSYKFVGNTTECALLVLAERLGFNHLEIQEKTEKAYRWNFSSARKRMSTVVPHPTKDKAFRLHCKGASEMVLKLCTKMLDAEGAVVNLPKDLATKLNDEIETLARKGLRTLALAYRDFSKKQDWKSSDDEGKGFEEELTLIALVGIEDPLRAEVPDAVRTCQRAGITVRMVTGDNILTAKKIAEDCNIYNPEVGLALEGPEFNEMTDDEVLAVADKLQVLARSKPNDKHRLVTLLKKSGRVVAVTGDGTNDGPALKAADVGLAMGIAGTEVAREAADIIILDDNFSSIVKSVMWGRCVFDNIRKFVQFQLTVNVGAIFLSFIGAVTRRGPPLTPIQLLWINLIMDTFAALALGTEKPTPSLLHRRPYGREGRLITWLMWRNIIGHSLLQVAIIFLILYGIGENGYHVVWTSLESGIDANLVNVPTQQFTFIFNTYVYCQVFNEFNARKVGVNEMNVFKGIFSNWYFLSIVVFISALQAVMVSVGGMVMRVVPIPWVLWLSSLGLAFLCVPFGFLLRLIRTPMEDWEKPTEEVAASLKQKKEAKEPIA